MGALLSLPITLLNLLLPFTRPGTPLLQDLIHTTILCTSLYFAPQIADWYHAQSAHANFPGTQSGTHIDNHAPQDTNDEAPDQRQPDDLNDADIPLDERLVLQDDGDGAPAVAFPHAPTPPPAQQRPRAPPLPHVEDFEDRVAGAFAAQAAAGPANDGPRATPANRTVGAKKAKSLARKEDRRRYHEWHRQEAHLRRLQEEEGKEEREAALQAERERRAAVEEEIREREREERDRLKREREQDMADEAERRERVMWRVENGVKKNGAVDLVDIAWAEGKERVWIEQLVRASGLLTQLQKGGEKVMVTGGGWLVKIDRGLMDEVYVEAVKYGDKNGGKVSIDQFGGFIEKAVSARVK